MNQAELERAINRMMSMTEPEIDLLIADPEAQNFDKFVAKIVKLGIEGGDERRLEFILRRMIGPVTESMEIKLPKPFVIERSSGDQIVLGAKMEDGDERK